MIRKKLFNHVVCPDDSILCPYCEEGTTIDSYQEYSKEYTGTGLDPIEYIKKYEGTFDMWSGLFTCTDCYLRIGMPSKEELFYHSYPTFRLKIKNLKHQNNYELKKVVL